MSGALGKGYIDVEADQATFTKSLDLLGGHADSAGLKLGKKLAGGLAAALTGKIAVDFLGGAMDEAREAEKVMAQTAAVIKSTGGAAGVSAKDVDRLATRISLMAGIDDEAIVSAENLLLTFTNIKNGKIDKIFDEAALAAVDMSVAMGTDAKGQAIALGKALNDPIKGISALTRVGVTFTDQQKEQIKAMVKAGDTAGAQKIILAELAKEFGGSAAAQATSADRMKVAFDNLKEQIGTALLPVVNAFFGFIIDKAIPAISELIDWVQTRLGPAFDRLVGWVRGNVIPAFEKVAGFITDTVIPALSKLVGWLVDNREPLTVFAAIIVAALIPAFVGWAVAAGAAAVATLAAAAPFVIVGAAVALLALLFVTHWDTIKQVTDVVWTFVKEKILPTVKTIVDFIMDVVGALVRWWDRNWNTIKAVVTVVWDVISTLIATEIKIIEKVISVTLKAIGVAWDLAWAVIGTAVKVAWTLISTAVQVGIDAVKLIIATVTAIITGDWGKVWDAIKKIVSDIWTGISKAVQTGIDGVKEIITIAATAINKAWDSVWNDLTGIVTEVFEKVKKIVTGAVGWIKDQVKQITDIPGQIGGFLTGGSGLKVPPHLASGGIVPGAPGVAVPAIVHGGELVLNRTQQSALWGQITGSGAGSKQYHLHLTATDPPNVLEQFRVLELLS